MDLDNAWDDFRKNHPIQKASISEKLDTLAAQLNEIQTDTKRTAEIVPKLMGDETALSNVAMDQPMDSMGGMGAPDMGMPAGEPGAEAMGEPTMDAGVEPPMGAGPDTGEDLMTNDVLDENPEPAASAPVEEETEEVELPAGDELGLGAEEDLGSESEDLDDFGIEGEELALDEDIPEEAPAAGGDSVSLLKEIINEEIADGNYSRAKKLLDALEAINGGETPEMSEEEVAPEAPVEETVEETVEEEPVVEDEEGTDPYLKSDANSMPSAGAGAGNPSAGLGAGDGGPVENSEDSSNTTVAEQIAVQAAEAVEGIVESVLGGDEEPEDGESTEEGEVEVKIEAEPEKEEVEEKEEDAVEENPFKDCNDMKKSAPIESLSFRDLYNARMAGRDIIGESIQKSESEDTEFTPLNPRQSARQAFCKAVTQLDQVQTANSLITGNAPTGDTQLDHVDEKKTVEGGPESVRGSVDAPKLSGADKLDEVDEEKPESQNPPKEGDQLDDVSNSKQARAKEGKDQLDQVDEEKSAGTYSEAKDQLDDVDAAKVKKSEDNGKEIMSFREMLSFIKSSNGRPDPTTSMNGEIVRPEPGSISKSADIAPVRMGYGVDPAKVMERDIAEYKAYMAQKRL